MRRLSKIQKLNSDYGQAPEDSFSLSFWKKETMNVSDFRDHPVFICGHPKSGTSLLRSLLDSHPEVVAYPEETVFFRRFLPAAKGCLPAEKMELADRLLTHIFEWNKDNPPAHQSGHPDRTYTQFPASQVRARVRERLNEQYRHDGDILSAVILAFGDVAGQRTDATRFWLEKTPYNEYFAKEIFGWWQQARCIHVIRDPRDNFVSYRRKHPDWDAEVFAHNWWRSTKAGLSNQARYGHERYFLISYEEFTQNPEEMLKQICDFLGIRDDQTLRIPTRAGDAWQGNSMFSNKFSGISAAAVGRWENTLKTEDLAVIEWTNRTLMTTLDYQLSTEKPKVSPSIRWRMLKKRIYTELRRNK